MKTTLLITMMNCFSICLSAQILKCGHHHYEQYLSDKFGIRGIHPESVNTHSNRGNNIYRIPVVVHIVHNNNTENLSDELIRSQIQVLNEDFRRLNADATETRDVFKNVAADAMIEFYLAETDPQGNPTNGITRTQTDKTSFIEIELDPFLIFQAALECGLDIQNPNPTEEQIACITEFMSENGLNVDELFGQVDNIKYSDKGGIDPWDQKRYLNIWVGDLSANILGDETPFLLGFAYPPVGAPLFPEGSLPDGYEENDGVVVHYQVFGKNNPTAGSLASTNNSGRTCVHEVGHYLGLRHVWGDGDCSVDDGIADTPVMESQSQSESFTTCEDLHDKNTCDDGTNDLPDMIENYMDYSPESCQNTFTQGQVNMMRAMLEGPRSELVGLSSSVVNTSTSLPVFVLPNPTNGFVEFKNANVVNTISIFNNAGQLLHNFKNTQAIDLSMHIPGLYFYQIVQENKISNGKIIIK